MRTIKELQESYEFYSKQKDDFAQGFLDAIKCIVDGKNEEEWEWEDWFDEYETGFHECLEWYAGGDAK